MRGMNVLHEQSLPATDEGKTRGCGGADQCRLVEVDDVGVGWWGQAGKQVPLVDGCNRSGFEGQIARHQGPVVNDSEIFIRR